MNKDDLNSLLPLTPSMFHILLALGRGPGHGYGIMKMVEKRTGGRLKLGPGILYGTLKKMLEEGLIREASAMEKASEQATPGPGRRYYELTPMGRKAAELESRRLAELLDWAKASRLLEASEKA